MYLIKSGQAVVVLDHNRSKVATLGPGDWFGEEVFQQAVQIERKRSTMVTGELTKQLQVGNRRRKKGGREGRRRRQRQRERGRGRAGK